MLPPNYEWRIRFKITWQIIVITYVIRITSTYFSRSSLSFEFEFINEDIVDVLLMFFIFGLGGDAVYIKLRSLIILRLNPIPNTILINAATPLIASGI